MTYDDWIYILNEKDGYHRVRCPLAKASEILYFFAQVNADAPISYLFYFIYLVGSVCLTPLP